MKPAVPIGLLLFNHAAIESLQADENLARRRTSHSITNLSMNLSLRAGASELRECRRSEHETWQQGCDEKTERQAGHDTAPPCMKKGEGLVQSPSLCKRGMASPPD